MAGLVHAVHVFGCDEKKDVDARDERGMTTSFQIALFIESSAVLRKHSRHRQSSPSTGIGSRAVSVAHQQSPPGLQANSVPQREQARRRAESVETFMTAL
jgi:hypothetical protein